jgi:ribulose-phosphate 3-epimerase
MGAPILSCVKRGVPDIFMDCHMMVAEPEKVRIRATSTVWRSLTNNPQWVNDIADAGGALYCFHIEATCTA